MFDLAWNGRGLILTLNNLPDHIIEMMIGWANEKIEAQNREIPGTP